MDRIPCAPNDNNAFWIHQQNQHHGEGIEELKHLLFCASLEVKRVRADAEAQSQIQEARLLHLQELLAATRRERDEAREQLLKLNHRLAEYSKVMNSQRHVMSSDRSQWPDTRLVAVEPDELTPSSTNTASAAATMHSNSSPLVGLADQFRWNSAGHYSDFGHLDLRPNVDLHQPPTSSPEVCCSNLELQEQPFYLVQDKTTDCSLWRQQQQEAGGTGIRQPLNQFLGIAEPSAGGHMAYHDPKPGPVFASSPSAILSSTPATMPAHLPETTKKSQVRQKSSSHSSDRVIVNNVETRLSILKRNKSSWASRTVSKVSEDENKTNQAPRYTDCKDDNHTEMIDDLLIISTDPLGPDPSVLPKEGSGILQSVSSGVKASEVIGNGLPKTLKEMRPVVSSDAIDYTKVGSSSSSGFASPVFESEKWAGPAYSNSPPPSSLPFPKFYMQQVRSIAMDLIDAYQCSDNVESMESSAVSPSAIAPEKEKSTFSAVRSCSSSSQFRVDTSATQDLRRLLGLD